MHLVTKRFSDSASLDAMMERPEALLDDEGLDVLASFLPSGGRPGEHPGNVARPRRFEVAAGLNRLRSVEMEPAS